MYDHPSPAWRRRRGACRARRRGLPALPTPWPPPGPLLGCGRHRRRPRKVFLRPPARPRHAREVDRRSRRHPRRPARHHPPPHGRADAPRGACRGPRLPRPAGFAGQGRCRRLRRRRSGSPPVAGMPLHRRHPCGSLSPGPRPRALPVPGAPLPSGASLPRRLGGATPAGTGRRRDRRRRRRALGCTAPGSTRAVHAKADVASPRGRPSAASTAWPCASARMPTDVAPLLVGEGIETVLSLVTAVPEITAAAALSAGSLGAFSVPPGCSPPRHRPRQRLRGRLGRRTPRPALRAGGRRGRGHRPPGRRLQRRPRFARRRCPRRKVRAALPVPRESERSGPERAKS